MAEKGEKTATRQCWDCLKRRLVCDYTVPHCKKCQKAGRQCSGYDDAKPLQWVQPGNVTSRRRKKKGESSPKACTGKSYTNSGDDYVCVSTDYEPSLAAWEEDQIVHLGNQATDLHVLSSKMAANAAEVARIFQFAGRAKIEEIVKAGSHKEAARILRSDRNPLGRLKRLLWCLQVQGVPIYEHLTEETSEVVQAVQYCG